MELDKHIYSCETKNQIRLSLREVGVLQYRAMGLSNVQIGRRLSISPNTVRHHITNILEKSGNMTLIEVVDTLLQSDQISRPEISTDLDFEKYLILSQEEKEFLDFIAKKDTWYDKVETLAYRLNIGKTTFWGKHTEITRKLGLGSKSLIRSRVFMLLNPYSPKNQIGTYN